MKDVSLGTVIAERVLTSRKLRNEVKVKIGSPQRTESGDFITPYQIVGVGDESVRFAAGLDSVQSLQLAFQMLGADIQHGFREYQFRWADREDSGFPTP